MASVARYESLADTIVKRFDKDMTTLGARVRQEVVLPICRKHGLRFLSGMGSMTFYNGSDPISSDDDVAYSGLSKAAQAELRAAFKILNIEVSHNNYVGFYVEAVKKGE